MCSVELVEVDLPPGERYEYGLEYRDEKKTLKHEHLSETLTPWTTMNRVYLFSTHNKENRVLSPPPVCVEIVLIKNVFGDQMEFEYIDSAYETTDDETETADHFEIRTLWRASEKNHYNPTIQDTQKQPDEKILVREYPWLFDKYSPGPLLSDSDSIEIRTIKPQEERPVTIALAQLRDL